MTLPTSVKMVEVGPRDGLQNEAKVISTDIKIEFINRLSETGLSVIEATSFVSPKWVPQMADHEELVEKIQKKPGVSYPVFVPNVKGLTRAISKGVKEIAVFTTPSEQFCQRNVNCSVADTLFQIAQMMEIAKQHQIKVRGYISCVLGCPYEGEISPCAVTNLVERLNEMGCYEISLGDTIGVGTPGKMQTLLTTVLKKIDPKKLAVHMHDTYGQALANIYVALENGIQTVDSSVAGLGGCPYAKGASGNVASEEVLYMLNGLNIKTGVDLEKLAAVGQFITTFLDRPMQSKVNLAMQSDTKWAKPRDANSSQACG
jgi:hydroxymethylglutaryl-CoA lyase